ncbi:hypothetical protein ACHAPJ_013522 [Fusarium lateritium]
MKGSRDPEVKKTKDHQGQPRVFAAGALSWIPGRQEWLDGTVQIKDDGDPDTIVPDTFSVYARFQICLNTPNYTIFYDKVSIAQYIKEHGGKPYYGVALEKPYGAIHLALGGFYEEGKNEMAAFNPIYFLYHAFINYTFWQSQLRNSCMTARSLTVKAGKDGTISDGGPAFKRGTPLNTDSALEPFKSANDLHTPPAEPIIRIVHVSNIKRSDYAGSFVIRIHAKLPNSDNEYVEIGREAVLGCWNVAGCANCQDHLDENSFIAIDAKTMGTLKGSNGTEKDTEFIV